MGYKLNLKMFSLLGNTMVELFHHEVDFDLKEAYQGVHVRF